jgi:hypothetical protein
VQEVGLTIHVDGVEVRQINNDFLQINLLSIPTLINNQVHGLILRLIFLRLVVLQILQRTLFLLSLHLAPNLRLNKLIHNHSKLAANNTLQGNFKSVPEAEVIPEVINQDTILNFIIPHRLT